MAATYRSRFPEIEAEIRPKIGAAIKAGSEAVAEAAKSRAPVQTGRLRDSIEARRDGVAQYEIVAGEFYGRFVEMGTVRAPAHPFLVPALEENKDAIVAAVEAALHGL